MKKFLFIVLLFISAYESFAKKIKIPEWVGNINGVFPESQYVCSLGKGADYEGAKSQAVSDLAAFLQSKVVSETIAENRLSKTDGETRRESDIISNVDVSSDVTLSGLSFTEGYYDKKKKVWFAAAYVEKNALWNQTESTLNQIYDNITPFMEEADSLEKKGDPLGAAKCLKSSLTLEKQFLANYAVLCALDYDKAHGKFHKWSVKVFGIDTRIKKDMTTGKVFVKVSGDMEDLLLNAATNAVKKSGFSVVKTKSEAQYILDVVFNQNMKTDGEGEDMIYACYPEISCELKNGSDVLYSWEKETNQKFASFQKANAVKKSVSACASIIKVEMNVSVQ